MIEIDILPASTDSQGGDSALIRIGTFSYDKERNNQQVILVDGGYKENSTRIVEYLSEHYQTNTIDIAIISHPDMDHISGFKQLLLDNNSVKIKKTFIHDPWNHAKEIFKRTEDGRRTQNSIKNSFEKTLKTLSETLDELDCLNIRNTEPFGVQKLTSFEDVSIYVLGPSKEYYQELLYCFPDMEGNEKNGNTDIYHENPVSYSTNLKHFLDNPVTSVKNDTSTILLVHSKSEPIALLTGDAGVKAIKNALDAADKHGLTYRGVKLFQIPHHGSIKNIEEAIIKRIKPKKTYVSAPPNCIKHPSRLLLNYLDNNGITVRHIKDKSGIRFSYDDAPDRPKWSPVKQFSRYEKVYKLK